MEHADADEECEDEQFHDHHDVVRPRTFAHPTIEQPGDCHDDGERRQVQQNRNPKDARRRLQKSMHRGIAAQQRGAIAVGEPIRKRNSKAGEQ